MINALASSEQHPPLPISSNAVTLRLVLSLDKYVSMKGEQIQEFTYEQMDLVPPQHRAILLADLQQRMGLPIHRVSVVNLDFSRDAVVLQVFYYDRD